MPEGRTYTIRQNRLEKAGLTNMAAEKDHLCFRGKGQFSCWLPALDSAIEDCPWGRLKLQMSLHGQFMVTVRAAALNEREICRNGQEMNFDEYLADENRSASEKEQFFSDAGGICERNKKDLLLYQLTGRYLWINITLEGEGSGEIILIKIYQKGDNFMDTFPEVYQERDSFFHRYLSVFSSIYNDFQRDIDHVQNYFDPDAAPKEMLPVLAGFMGLDVTGDFLEEKVLRALVKNAYSLNKIKGTREALLRVTEIVLGEKAVILEKCRQKTYHGWQQVDADITVLIKTQVEQKKKARLMFLLEQFKPARCSMKILFLKKGGSMDRHTYMDMNAMILDGDTGRMDTGQNYQNLIIK